MAKQYALAKLKSINSNRQLSSLSTTRLHRLRYGRFPLPACGTVHQPHWFGCFKLQGVEQQSTALEHLADVHMLRYLMRLQISCIGNGRTCSVVD